MKKLLLGLFCAMPLPIHSIDENNDFKEQCKKWYHETYNKLNQEQKSKLRDFLTFISDANAQGLDLIEGAHYASFASYSEKTSKEMDDWSEKLNEAQIQLPEFTLNLEYFKKLYQVQSRIYQAGGHTTEQYSELCMQDAECKEFFMKTLHSCISNNNTILQTIEEQEILEQQQ